MELLQEALAQPADSPVRQLAETLLSQQETALTELGMDVEERFDLSRTDQLELIEQVADQALTDQTVGNWPDW